MIEMIKHHYPLEKSFVEEGNEMQQTKEEKVHNVFETISDNYDKMNSIISFQTAYQMALRYNETNECSKGLKST